MNLKCISLAAVIFLAAVSAACTGTGDQDLSGTGIEQPVEPAPGGEEPSKPGEEPVEPADPNAPSDPSKGGSGSTQPGSGGTNATAPGSLADAFAGVKTTRVNYQVLEDACDNDAKCLADLEAYKAAIAERCTDAAVVDVACPQGITQFNTDIPESQLRAGRVPVGYPSADDVVNSVGEIGSGGGGDEPAAGEEPAAAEPGDLEKVVKTLEEWATAHDRVAADLIDTACTDADCKAGLMALVDYIRSDCGGAVCPAGTEGLLDTPTADETASGELAENFPLTKDIIDVAKSLEAAPAAP